MDDQINPRSILYIKLSRPGVKGGIFQYESYIQTTDELFKYHVVARWGYMGGAMQTKVVKRTASVIKAAFVLKKNAEKKLSLGKNYRQVSKIDYLKEHIRGVTVDDVELPEDPARPVASIEPFNTDKSLTNRDVACWL